MSCTQKQWRHASVLTLSYFLLSRCKSYCILVRILVRYGVQVTIEQGHLMDALAACTDQAHIALKVLRLNEELDLKIASKMYAKALEVRGASIHSSPSSFVAYSRYSPF